MIRDISFATFGAILGALVSYFVQGFDINSPLSWVVVGGLVLAMIITLIAIGPLPLILSPSGNIFLSDDKWRGSWQFINRFGEEVVVTEEVTWKQYGRFVIGDAQSTSITGGKFFNPNTHYKLQGQINADGTISGKWWSVIPGRRYQGYFQAALARSGRQLSGRWLGLDDGKINGGEFTWEH